VAEPENVELLIVDDDPDFRGTLARRFMRRGYNVHEASDGEEALAEIEGRHFDVAIVDMVMPGMSGLDLLEQFRTVSPECESIVLTGQATIESAVAAIKLGAYDYLTKPFPLVELELLIRKASERGVLKRENRHLKSELARTEPKWEIVGKSQPMQDVFRIISRAGPTENAILIQGESGTGKELVARALHRSSRRCDKPLVVINCAAMPESLLESELFGHEKGAFTGAISTKPGLFEVADGGTLFIDEIGEIPGSVQVKLLRVLEDGSIRRIGSLKERRVNIRLLAATNRQLQDEVAAGRFREDLYYRINVMSLELPPLRERPGDIGLLVERFVGQDWTIEPEAIAAMARFFWPGNVRQLINAVERAKVMSDDTLIRLVDLPPEITQPDTTITSGVSSGSGDGQPSDELSVIERSHIIEVLSRERGNKARAARTLGVNRRSLYRLIDKYGIEPGEYADD
jgi:DNA-binding NtrC family response regulator